MTGKWSATFHDDIDHWKLFEPFQSRSHGISPFTNDSPLPPLPSRTDSFSSTSRTGGQSSGVVPTTSNGPGSSFGSRVSRNGSSSSPISSEISHHMGGIQNQRISGRNSNPTSHSFSSSSQSNPSSGLSTSPSDLDSFFQYVHDNYVFMRWKGEKN